MNKSSQADSSLRKRNTPYLHFAPNKFLKTCYFLRYRTPIEKQQKIITVNTNHIQYSKTRAAWRDTKSLLQRVFSVHKLQITLNYTPYYQIYPNT